MWCATFCPKIWHQNHGVRLLIWDCYCFNETSTPENQAESLGVSHAWVRLVHGCLRYINLNMWTVCGYARVLYQYACTKTQCGTTCTSAFHFFLFARILLMFCPFQMRLCHGLTRGLFCTVCVCAHVQAAPYGF